MSMGSVSMDGMIFSGHVIVSDMAPCQNMSDSSWSKPWELELWDQTCFFWNTLVLELWDPNFMVELPAGVSSEMISPIP